MKEGESMSDNKDELLKKQNEEIQKLKKELKAAAKPSSMFSVLKNTVKRNVHDFFIREDKMKTMDSKIKDLEKELAKKEEELNKTSAELFAAVNLGQTCGPVSAAPLHMTDGDKTSEHMNADNKEDIPLFPQTAEEAVKEYFGPLDLASLAKQKFPEAEPEQKITAYEEKTLHLPEPEQFNNSKNIVNDSSDNTAINADSSEIVQKEIPENQLTQKPTEQKPKRNITPDNDKKEQIQNNIKNDNIKPVQSVSLPQKKNIKTGDAKEPNTDKDNQKESIKKEKQESVPAQPQPQNSEAQPVQQPNSKNPTATVVDKNGKRKAKKDKRKNQNKQASQVIIKQPAIQEVKKDEQRKENTTAAISIPEPSAEPEIELPDDFGIVIEPEEPELSDLPDINSSPSGETSVFDDLFNSDSDNWDDSNI